jgi:hypothetical protein
MRLRMVVLSARRCAAARMQRTAPSARDSFIATRNAQVCITRGNPHQMGALTCSAVLYSFIIRCCHVVIAGTRNSGGPKAMAALQAANGEETNWQASSRLKVDADVAAAIISAVLDGQYARPNSQGSVSPSGLRPGSEMTDTDDHSGKRYSTRGKNVSYRSLDEDGAHGTPDRHNAGSAQHDRSGSAPRSGEGGHGVHGQGDSDGSNSNGVDGHGARMHDSNSTSRPRISSKTSKKHIPPLTSLPRTADGKFAPKVVGIEVKKPASNSRKRQRVPRFYNLSRQGFPDDPDTLPDQPHAGTHKWETKYSGNFEPMLLFNQLPQVVAPVHDEAADGGRFSVNDASHQG